MLGSKIATKKRKIFDYRKKSRGKCFEYFSTRRISLTGHTQRYALLFLVKLDVYNLFFFCSKNKVLFFIITWFSDFSWNKRKFGQHNQILRECVVPSWSCLGFQSAVPPLSRSLRPPGEYCLKTKYFYKTWNKLKKSRRERKSEIVLA